MRHYRTLSTVLRIKVLKLLNMCHAYSKRMFLHFYNVDIQYQMKQNEERI